MASLEERYKDLFHSHVWHAVSLVLVTIEKAILVTHATEDLDLVNCVDVDEAAVQHVHK